MKPLRILILGASRGLGRALALHASAQGHPVVGFSRKEALLRAMAAEEPLFQFELADFAKVDDQERVLAYIRANPFDKIFLVAGGGPYGLFHERALRDHIWAWETSFVFHAKVLHLLATLGRKEQTIVIGSSVAEAAPDPNAASYCAAKHALRGLCLTLRSEYPGWDIRLFSPGYMDTDLLPKNAAVRKDGVHDVSRVAEDLWRWTLTAPGEAHKMYPKLQETM